MKPRVIAIDLDSTIWTEDFPNLGVPYPDAIETINDMIKAGFEIVIWTSRDIENANKSIYHLIDEYGLNPNVKINVHSNIFLGIYDKRSVKIAADIYIDDKAYGAPKSFEHEWKNIRKRFGL